MNTGSTPKTIQEYQAALDRTRQVVELQLQLFQSSHLSDIGAIQKHVLSAASRLLGCQRVSMYLFDQPRSEWLSRISLDEDGTWDYQVISEETDEIVKQCLQAGKIQHAVSVLCAPVVFNNTAQGAMQAVKKKTGDFDANDQELLLMLAKVAANSLSAFLQIGALKTLHSGALTSRWELANSRNTLRALFDNLPTALYIIDREYRLAAVNRNRAGQLVTTSKPLIGSHCYQALFNRSSPCPQCRVNETFENGTSTQRNERRILEPENPIDLEISVYPIFDEENQAVQAILIEQDISEKRRLESILTQSEKLAAVGQLAAGVAHEINNPLTAIIANAQIIHRELPADHDLQESVDLITRAGARAAQVIRNLLDFARREEFKLDLIDINNTLRKSLELVQHELIARHIQLVFDADPCLPALVASEDNLQSVWLNLLLNAIDSIDKEAPEIHLVTHCQENCIQVSVRDNGRGIPAEQIPRIFEPFYTTKAPGRGTGLGLSLSNRIVKQHGGSIQVESQAGSGSCFTVILPLT